MSRLHGVVSTNYRELEPGEVETVARECSSAWQDDSIPARQYELAVQAELEGYRGGVPCAPFDALVRSLRRLPTKELDARPRLLDAGASGGYYSEVLRIAGIDVQYTGLDFSPAFKALAEQLYPGICFEVGDVRSMPFHDDWFDVVVSGAVLMHVFEAKDVIREAARVSRKYIVFHRTPVLFSKPTTYFEKLAYGVRVFEVHFNEMELLSMFRSAGLILIYYTDVFRDETFGHRTYLLKKEPSLNHVQV